MSTKSLQMRLFGVWTYSIHPVLPLLISARLREGIQTWSTKLSSGVWPSWGWMSSTGLLQRSTCQWLQTPRDDLTVLLSQIPSQWLITFSWHHNSWASQLDKRHTDVAGWSWRGCGALICTISPGCLRGLQSVGVPHFADKTWVGPSASSGAVSHTSVFEQRVL